MSRYEPRRLVTKPLSTQRIFDATKTIDFSTKQKFYTPILRGRPLLKMFYSKSPAIRYAKLVYIRYQEKLRVQKALLARAEYQKLLQEELGQEEMDGEKEAEEYNNPQEAQGTREETSKGEVQS